MKKNKYSPIYEQIAEDKKYIAEKLIEDIIFMDSTLAMLRSQIAEEGAVEEFKQGKQEFMRESPALKSYNNTCKQRNSTYTQLLSMIPKIAPSASSDPFDEFIAESDRV